MEETTILFSVIHIPNKPNFSKMIFSHIILINILACSPLTHTLFPIDFCFHPSICALVSVSFQPCVQRFGLVSGYQRSRTEVRDGGQGDPGAAGYLKTRSKQGQGQVTVR